MSTAPTTSTAAPTPTIILPATPTTSSFLRASAILASPNEPQTAALQASTFGYIQYLFSSTDTGTIVPRVGGLAGSANFTLDLVGGTATVSGPDQDIDPTTMMVRKVTTLVSGATPNPWFPIAVNAPFTLPVGSLGFEVRLQATYDTRVEGNETFQLVAKQTGVSDFVANSFWVPTTIVILDNIASSYNATITADTNNLTSVDEGQNVTAVFKLDYKQVVDQLVHVSIMNMGASANDYTGFTYQLDNGTPIGVPGSGDILILAGTRAFTLGTQFVSDTLANETGEAITFTVSQDASSTHLINSWWVTQNVAIVDKTAFQVAKITAASTNPTSVNEGDLASVSFNLSNALTADSTINVALQNWGATFSGSLKDVRVHNTTGVDTYVTADPLGNVTLPVGATGFDLESQIPTDSIDGEHGAIAFTVSQDPSSTSLFDSYYVLARVGINDVSTGTIIL